KTTRWVKLLQPVTSPDNYRDDFCNEVEEILYREVFYLVLDTEFFRFTSKFLLELTENLICFNFTQRVKTSMGDMLWVCSCRVFVELMSNSYRTNVGLPSDSRRTPIGLGGGLKLLVIGYQLSVISY